VSDRDTGIGIRIEHLDRLFGTFSRIPAQDVQKQEGTALGLYLSKKIASRLGGEITAESEFGRGSEFTFILPLNHEGVQIYRVPEERKRFSYWKTTSTTGASYALF